MASLGISKQGLLTSFKCAQDFSEICKHKEEITYFKNKGRIKQNFHRGKVTVFAI